MSDRYFSLGGVSKVLISLAVIIGTVFVIIQWNSDPMFKWIIGLIAGIVAVRMFGGRK